MKKPIGPAVALLLLLCAVRSPAQQTPPASGFVIRGRVLDATSGGSLAGASVVARLESDTSRSAGALTRADGSFRIEGLGAGRYTVAATYLGRTARAAEAVTVSAQAPLASVGELRITTVVALEGVEVTSQRSPVVHAEDRTIYNVQEMPAVTGGAADVMRTLPELEVDIDGNIKMVGGRGVTIHINSRPSPLKGEALTEFIKNLPADRIERVEVIPNPSVRFESGEAAIVNIILKRGTQLGLSGSVSLNASTKGGNGISGQIAYQAGKLTLFGGGSARLHEMEQSYSELRENLFARPVTFLGQTSTYEGRSLFAGGDLTAEYQASEQGTLWASGGVYGGDWKSDGASAFRILDAEQALMRSFDRRTRFGNGMGFSTLAAGYRHIVEPQRHELAAELRLRTNDADQDGRFAEEMIADLIESGLPPEVLRLTGGGSGETALTAKVDYTRPWGKGGRIELGVRGEREDSDEDARLDVFESLAGNTPPVQSSGTAYTFRDDQLAAYVNASRKFGKLSLQGGLRAEHAARMLRARGAASTFERDHFTVFPSANANYDFAPGRALRLSYSKRVRRPWIWDLNPFILETDPLNRRFGNPALDPSETHSLNLDLSWRVRQLTLRLAPNYQHTRGGIEYIRTVDEHGVSTVMPQNLTSERSYGGSLTASARPITGANVSVTAGASWMERDADRLNPAYSGRGRSSYLNTNGSMQLGRGASVQSSMRISGARETPQGRNGSNVYSDLALRQTVLGDKVSLDLRLTDPFDVYRFSFTARDPSYSSSSQSRSSWGARSASFSVSYRFGKMPKKKSSDTEVGDAPAMPAGPGM
jgi:outer membrane receptor protein involved in Fe transport